MLWVIEFDLQLWIMNQCFNEIYLFHTSRWLILKSNHNISQPTYPSFSFFLNYLYFFTELWIYIWRMLIDYSFSNFFINFIYFLSVSLFLCMYLSLSLKWNLIRMPKISLSDFLNKIRICKSHELWEVGCLFYLKPLLTSGKVSIYFKLSGYQQPIDHNLPTKITSFIYF